MSKNQKLNKPIVQDFLDFISKCSEAGYSPHEMINAMFVSIVGVARGMDEGLLSEEDIQHLHEMLTTHINWYNRVDYNSAKS